MKALYSRFVQTRLNTILNTESTIWGKAETNIMHKTILYRLFCCFFDNNNPAFHKTNSSGKTLDTGQKIFCAPLLG